MNKRIWLLVFGVVLLLAGCSNLTAPTATLEASATEELPTQITIAPTRTSTFTPEPSLTSTQTVTQTLKPFSTEAIGECRLPCWWGITPGVTTWDQALDTLSHLKNHYKELSTSDIYISIDMLDGGYISFRRNQSNIIDGFRLRTSHSNGIDYFDLLSEFGEPSDIYLFTWKDFQTRPPWLGKGERPARVFFYYAGKGILAEYEFFGTLNDTTGIITICPNITEQELKLDPNGTEYSQNDISHIFLGIDEIPIHKIDEATSLTKHDFFMRYKDKNQTGCFKTPVSLWQ